MPRANVILQRNSVTVRVPATTANLGAGFDSIGMALDLWNELTVERAEDQLVEIVGEGAECLPTDDTNLVLVGMKAAFKLGTKCLTYEGFEEELRLEVDSPKSLQATKLPPFHYKCTNRIPFARGLGSSSAAVVSGLVAGLVLMGIELPVLEEEALFNIASNIEGHPDNVAPAIYGGLQIGVRLAEPEDRIGVNPHPDQMSPQGTRLRASLSPTGAGRHRASGWRTSRVALPHGLQCVLFLPDSTLETAKARAVIPTHVSRADAIFNASRCALMVNALATGVLQNLQVAMDDRLHQPYRGENHIGYLYPMIDAAVAAGAHGACLSGAGPAILALTSGVKGDIFTQRQVERTELAVATAMRQVAKEAKIEGRVLITQPSQRGAHVVSAEPRICESSLQPFGDHI